MTARTLAAAALTALLAAHPLAAQEFPAKAVTIIVPFAAGGPTDLIARMFAQGMAADLGQQVVVENVGGAGGTIGVVKAARATPDGYTLLLGNIGTQAANAHFYKQPRYDPVAEFDPVANLADVPQVLVARKDFPATGLAEFAAYARANADRLKYATAGIGVSSHLGGMLVNAAIGADVRMIPYRGTAPAMTDLLSGVIDYMSDQSTTTFPQIKAGTVKPIAILSTRRSPALPDLPTAKEQGVDVEVVVWNALFAPKGAPADRIERIWRSVRAARQDPAVTERLAALGGTFNDEATDGPEGLGRRLAADIARLGPVIRAAGVQLD